MARRRRSKKTNLSALFGSFILLAIISGLAQCGHKEQPKEEAVNIETMVKDIMDTDATATQNFATSVMPTATMRPTQIPPTPTVNTAVCRIKGNVSTRNGNKKIYHCPNFPDYSKTEVNKNEGDRWFCTEEEAIAAGFRKPENVSDACIP